MVGDGSGHGEVEMTDLLDLFRSFESIPWVTFILIAAVSIGAYEGARRLLQREVTSSFRSTAAILTDQVNQQSGILSEHQHRLEILRSDVAHAESRISAAFAILDKLKLRGDR
jgi:hypothetical protein